MIFFSHCGAPPDEDGALGANGNDDSSVVGDLDLGDRARVTNACGHEVAFVVEPHLDSLVPTAARDHLAFLVDVDAKNLWGERGAVNGWAKGEAERE